MKQLRCIIWAAVSTREQADEDDKISIPNQLADAKALAERENWTIVDTLVVPGHSRSYDTIAECAADMRRQGIDAFDALIRHFESKDFDRLVVRDGDRFARTVSMHAEVVQKTYRAGAAIHSLVDGLITEDTRLLWTTLNGYKAQSNVEGLVMAHRRSLEANVRSPNPRPKVSTPPMSHRIVRDESGKSVRYELKEEHKKLWIDLANLILEGVPYQGLELELFKRFNHGKNGTHHTPMKFYALLNTPSFWGHTALYLRSHHGKPLKYLHGEFVWEEGHEIPEPVIIHYNTHPPAYTGELAEQVKAEMRRRSATAKGRSHSYRTAKFAGLFLCGECGYYLVMNSRNPANVRAFRLYCQSPYLKNERRGKCSQKKMIREDKFKAYIDALLRQMVINMDATFFTSNISQNSIEYKLKLVQAEITRLEDRLTRLINQHADATDETQYLYANQINIDSETFKKRKAEERELLAEVSHTNIAQQEQALGDIIQTGLEAFWSLPDQKINQYLHRLMQDARFVVLNGEIVGFAKAPKRNGNFRKYI